MPCGSKDHLGNLSHVVIAIVRRAVISGILRLTAPPGSWLPSDSNTGASRDTPKVEGLKGDFASSFPTRGDTDGQSRRICQNPAITGVDVSWGSEPK